MAHVSLAEWDDKVYEVLWKDPNPYCPCCLGAKKVILTPFKMVDGKRKERPKWIPCPACDKKFA